jgi:hypothetical protein
MMIDGSTTPSRIDQRPTTFGSVDEVLGRNCTDKVTVATNGCDPFESPDLGDSKQTRSLLSLRWLREKAIVAKKSTSKGTPVFA